MLYRPEQCIIVFGAVFSLELRQYSFCDINKKINKKKRACLPMIRRHLVSGRLCNPNNMLIIGKDTLQITLYYQLKDRTRRQLKPTRRKEILYFKKICDVRKISKYYESMKYGKPVVKKGNIIKKDIGEVKNPYLKKHK